MSSSTPPPPRRAKHLIDPTKPRPRTTPEDLARLKRVQQWVLSVLIGTTIFHLSVGLVIAAVVIDPSQVVARVGLCVLGGGFGVIAIAAALFIHEKKPVSPWLLLGLVPTVVGLFLVL